VVYSGLEENPLLDGQERTRESVTTTTTNTDALAPVQNAVVGRPTKKIFAETMAVFDRAVVAVKAPNLSSKSETWAEKTPGPGSKKQTWVKKRSQNQFSNVFPLKMSQLVVDDNMQHDDDGAADNGNGKERLLFHLGRPDHLHVVGVNDDNNNNNDDSRATRRYSNNKVPSLAQRGYIGIKNTTTTTTTTTTSAGATHPRLVVRFAVVGDVHGQFSIVKRQLQQFENDGAIGGSLDFILQVGDLECHRHEQDLESMAAPSHHRRLGDFATTVLQQQFAHDNNSNNKNNSHDNKKNPISSSYWPCPFYCIGGNHECFGWLDDETHYQQQHQQSLPRQARAFLELAPNMFYLGRAGYLPLRFYSSEPSNNNNDNNNNDNSPRQQQYQSNPGQPELNILGVLNLAYLTGIEPAGQGSGYTERRPAMTNANLHTRNNKAWIGFNIYDINALLQDQPDDGIDHHAVVNSSHRHNDDDDDDDDEWKTENLYSMASRNNEAVIYVQDLATRRQKITFLLAQLLGVNLTLSHIQQIADPTTTSLRPAMDIVLSKADVQFLTRYLIPHQPLRVSMEETWAKRQAAAYLLPTTLSGMVTFVVHGHSKKDDLDQLMVQKERFHRKRAVDILLTHDWPANVVTKQEMYGSSDTGDRRVRPVGNAVCRQVLDGLKPTLHCCGHMHRGYRKQIQHVTTTTGELLPGVTTKLCCLGKVGESGAAAFAVFEYDLETGAIEEITSLHGIASSKQI
jgi:hypothetical protein